MDGIWKTVNLNFLSKPRPKGAGLLIWSAAINVYAAIDLKVTFQVWTRVSIDSGFRNVSNGTFDSLMTSKGE